MALRFQRPWINVWYLGDYLRRPRQPRPVNYATAWNHVLECVTESLSLSKVGNQKVSKTLLLLLDLITETSCAFVIIFICEQASNVGEVLLRHIEYMVRDTCAWFSQSHNSLQQVVYSEKYEIL